MPATPAPLTELMHVSWARALAPVEPTIRELGDFLRAEQAAGHGFLPAAKNIFRAFQAPLDSVRVLIVGQDPYPTPGHPIGLSFAVDAHVRPLPRSLQNIYAELHADLGIEPAAHGDLSAWSAQGVMLLNRVLTVRAGAPASHRGRGWEAVTECAIRALVARREADGSATPLVALLWGRDARTLEPLMAHAPGYPGGRGVPVVASAHPSPLSAQRGFFGSHPFSTANTLLETQGAQVVDWHV